MRPIKLFRVHLTGYWVTGQVVFCCRPPGTGARSAAAETSELLQL